MPRSSARLPVPCVSDDASISRQDGSYQFAATPPHSSPPSVAQPAIVVVVVVVEEEEPCLAAEDHSAGHDATASQLEELPLLRLNPRQEL